jgi:hypothetical protein
VAPTPVLAAGGIATGRQMAAALALGAEGRVVRVGVAHDARSGDVADHPREVPRGELVGYAALALVDRQAGADAAQRPGPTPGTSPRHPSRCRCRCRASWWPIRSARIHRVAHKEDSPARPLVTYFVGQVVGQMNVAMSARDVVREMVEECLDTMERMNGVFGDE